MLAKRSQIYEVHKPVVAAVSPPKSLVNHNGARSSLRGPSSKSSGCVHSNSFNYSSRSSTGTTTTASSHSTVTAPKPAPRRSLRPPLTKQPRMGIPMMTSTPSRTPLQSTEEEEPIYSEIPSPCKIPSSFDIRGSSRLECKPQQQQQKQRPKTNGVIITGLGRRAITQLDMASPRERRPFTDLVRPPLTSNRILSSWQQINSSNKQHEQQANKTNQALFETQKSSNLALREKKEEEETKTTSEEEGLSSSSTALLRGVLWQQREKRFSRWKERFFILTSDYLQCFRKGTSKISEMGAFIYRVRLCEVEDIELIERRGYLTLRLALPRDGGKLLLRKTDGIRKWFSTLEDTVQKARKRRVSMKTTEEFWTKRQHTDSSCMESWILARQRVGQQYCWSDTGSCVSDTASTTILPNHLKSADFTRLNNLETASALGRKTYNNLKTTHYGLIDWPSKDPESHLALAATKKKASILPSSPSSIVGELNGRRFLKESVINHSHDSGVDSMNTNSSGISSSASSRQKSPLMLPLDLGQFSRQMTLV